MGRFTAIITGTLLLLPIPIGQSTTWPRPKSREQEEYSTHSEPQRQTGKEELETKYIGTQCSTEAGTQEVHINGSNHSYVFILLHYYILIIICYTGYTLLDVI